MKDNRLILALSVSSLFGGCLGTALTIFLLNSNLLTIKIKTLSAHAVRITNENFKEVGVFRAVDGKGQLIITDDKNLAGFLAGVDATGSSLWELLNENGERRIVASANKKTAHGAIAFFDAKDRLRLALGGPVKNLSDPGELDEAHLLLLDKDGTTLWEAPKPYK